MTLFTKCLELKKSIGLRISCSNVKHLCSNCSSPKSCDYFTDLKRQIIFETHGSRVAVGAVFKKRFEDTHLKHWVGWFSRVVTGSKRNNFADKVKFYAIISALELFCKFVLRRKVLFKQIKKLFAIIFGEMCSRQHMSNAGIFAFPNTTSSLYTRQVKTI